MVISSLVVETDPTITQQVANKLTKNAGVEVHEINEYKIVVTIEAGTLDESHHIASSFVMVPGVIGVNLVYVNFEDDPTTQKVATQ
ncbi:MAG: chaperone NapD [Gordonibacter sp.]|nr:chaperone NapD [Gordonibacter sp.]